MKAGLGISAKLRKSPIEERRRDEHLPMTQSCMINRGDIFWLDSDRERGSTAGLRHPHVVIQDDVFNHSRIETIVVCALTSNLKRANEPGNILLDVGEGHLPKQSVLVVSQVSAVPRVQLVERIGALCARRIDQILQGMRFQQASFFRR